LIISKQLKGCGDKIKKLEDENKRLRESKDITEYFCETHPLEKISFFSYEKDKFICNVCLLLNYYDREYLKLFCPKKLEKAL